MFHKKCPFRAVLEVQFIQIFVFLVAPSLFLADLFPKLGCVGVPLSTLFRTSEAGAQFFFEPEGNFIPTVDFVFVSQLLQK